MDPAESKVAFVEFKKIERNPCNVVNDHRVCVVNDNADTESALSMTMQTHIFKEYLREIKKNSQTTVFYPKTGRKPRDTVPFTGQTFLPKFMQFFNGEAYSYS